MYAGEIIQVDTSLPSEIEPIGEIGFWEGIMKVGQMCCLHLFPRTVAMFYSSQFKNNFCDQPRELVYKVVSECVVGSYIKITEQLVW